eukprot:Pompholyxophrys_punicea_v1_NODE_236_length_2608_cov_7.122601.p3 type:complete len:104 gc:universal NODE_236_length_2608_cov_7.122601:462-151(-)
MWPSLYADDTNLFAFSRSLPDLVEICLSELKEVEDWFNSNFLQPNASKSSLLFFASPRLRNRRIGLPLIEFEGTQLATKFLGVYLNSSSLNWADHIFSGFFMF